MPWIIVFLMLIEFSSAKLASIGIYWNASNPIFRIDNTDHIIDVNKGNNPFEYDQVNIICPTYTEGSKEEAETYIIYNVSKEEYDTCRITNSNPRIIAICDNPLQLKYFTITFRSFTPQPGGLEFKPGLDYYFVTTSTGKREGLDRRFGGRCSTHHMKVIFKVCCSDSTSSDSNNAVGNKTSSSASASSSSSNHHQLSIESSSTSTIVSSAVSSSTHFPPHHVTSPSHLISTLSPSSSSSSSYQSLNKEPLFNDWTSLLGSFSDNSNTLMGGIVSSSLSTTSTTTIVPVPVPVTSIPSLFSTTLIPPSLHPSSTIPAASEHWWKPHFTRIENLKWRSKNSGSNSNVVRSSNSHHQGKGDPANTNDSNTSSRNTLQPIAWTVFAISCFIFIIFWALWYKVKRNNVMLPMSK